MLSLFVLSSFASIESGSQQASSDIDILVGGTRHRQNCTATHQELYTMVLRTTQQRQQQWLRLWFVSPHSDPLTRKPETPCLICGEVDGSATSRYIPQCRSPRPYVPLALSPKPYQPYSNVSKHRPAFVFSYPQDLGFCLRF